MIDQPKLPPSVELPWVTHFENDDRARARCFLSLSMTAYLVKIINPKSSWPDRMKEHLKSFPNLSHLNLDLASMGAPVDWDDLWLTIKNPSAVFLPKQINREGPC